MTLEQHYRALRRLRKSTRRTPKWSAQMVHHLRAIERITGEWESY